MASADFSQSEETFFCSICLEVFTEPVSTPCGHNYCKGCITSYWASRDFSQCPLCNEPFHTAPELRVNTEFKDMLKLFNRMKVAGDDGSPPAGPGEVPCDICHGMKHKAVKSCLVCLTSYCNAHLKPHHTVQVLKWHELINPVETLEDRVCRKHNKVIEFFCRKDQSRVCFVCLRDDHVMHDAISLEEEFKERKIKLKCAKRQVQHNLNEKCHMVLRIQNSMMEGRQEVETTKAGTVEAFAALVASIRTKKVKLIELLEEKQAAAEQKAKALIRQLWLEIAEDRQTSIKLEELSKTEDDFQLLQRLPSSTSNTKDCFTDPQSLLQVETVRSAVAKIEETLNTHMENIIKEVNLADNEETFEELQIENVFDDELGKIQEQYAIKVTLDPDTAHPSLIVSEDMKQVRDGGSKRNIPSSPKRFESVHFVLGNEGFSSGKFYYEVSLKGQTGWEVGVVRESINRKGFNWSLSPENGCWTLGLYWGRCQANTNPPVLLPLIKDLQKVGVFVDFDEGLVSFYDVDTRAQIYSFTGCFLTGRESFLSKILAFAVKDTAKVYPLFRPCAETESPPLQIAPVGCTKGK
ncbi:E3 ubiquitin-protein ligase TRIM58-like isoform X2 [Cottoperca gobio]|nr:E3 ubiquitin-protein ligase TRIM58-like isoform X2 [Cottoperca gobio]XP_029301541.1 E3 ubiquitin-protein ligase TRIM58-like isoform X2 [Cottoperca gobio]